MSSPDAVQHVHSEGEFNRLVAGDRLVVVDFFAQWCGPCHAVAPAFASLASRYSHAAVFVMLDVDECRSVAMNCAVSAMPSFHFYRNGRKIDEVVGANLPALEAKVAELATAGGGAQAFGGTGRALGSSGAGSSAQGGGAVDRTVLQQALQRLGAPAPTATTHATASATAPTPAAGKSAAAPSPSSSAAAAAPSRPNLDTVAQLESMGFPEVRAVKACIATENASLETAMDWIFAHDEDADIDEPPPGYEAMIAPSEQQRQTAAGEHAERDQSERQQPSSTSSLTPEEQQRRLRELMQANREKRSVREEQHEREREQNRLRSGRDMDQAKRRQEEQQRKRDAEKRRHERAEDERERARLRQLLAQDRQTRLAEQQQQQPQAPQQRAYAEPQQAAEEEAEATTAAAPSRLSAAEQRSAARIQLRLPDGSRLEHEFAAGATLREVCALVQRERPDIGADIVLSNTYPRKRYSASELDLTLQGAQLFPRGALIVSRGR